MYDDHDHPAEPGTDTAYQWPACTNCARRLWIAELGRLICRPCQTAAQQHLTELADLHTQLNTARALMPDTAGSRASSTSSGTPSGQRLTAPIPVHLDVLNLTSAGGLVTRLRDIEDSWRTALGWTHPVVKDPALVRTFAPWRTNPAADVPRHLRFLLGNLEWACASYPEIAQDLQEIRRLHTEAGRALARTPRPARIKVGACPVLLADDTTCGTPLTATAGSRRIHCPGCGTHWDDLAAWRDLRTAQGAVLVPAA